MAFVADFEHGYSPEEFVWIYIKDIEEEINQLEQNDLKGLAAMDPRCDGEFESTGK